MKRLRTKKLRKILFGAGVGVAVVLLVVVGVVGGALPGFTPQGDGDGYDIPVNSFYNRDSAHWLELDNEFTAAVAPWDWEVLEADYHLSVKEDFTAGQILEFSLNASTVQFQPMALEWSNSLSQIQAISMPQDVTPVVTNPEVTTLGSVKHQGTITWNDAYGANIDFEWTSTPAILKKMLTISSLSDLPTPEQYIIDGGDPFLRLNLIFAPSSDLDIYVDDNLWNKQTEVQTFDIIEFRKEGEILWVFMPLMYWDSMGSEGQSVATLEKSGNNLYISVRVPYSWLQSATYPVFIDTDIQIESAGYTTLYKLAVRGGPFWTSPTVGYVIYVNSAMDLKYQKTQNGGADWDGAVNIKTGSIYCYDSWADWQTVDDSGTEIHIVYLDAASEDVRYVYLDTSTDTVGGDDEIKAIGTGLGGIGWSSNIVSITKTRGGNLAVAIRYYKDTPAYEYYFYTSPDATTWTSEALPWESDVDYILLFPGNEADNQDVWGVFWDVSVNGLTLKTYDDSGDSWSESSSIDSASSSDSYLQMDGAIRLSDGHLIFAVWNIYDTANADLAVWDINGSGSLTQKTDVLTDSPESFLTSVFINQANDDIYVAYAKGGVITQSVKIYYKKSTDGGDSWGSQEAFSVTADDQRWLSCGAVKADWGGKFQPVWFDDDFNDLWTNTDNGISIAAPSAGYPHSYGTIIG